jgi:hypothetical protein
VHSFTTLLKVLASQARVTYVVRTDAASPSFQLIPEPTPLQARAYELPALLPVTNN